jgi:hypothetical protein
MKETTTRWVHGALAGMMGAACMTVLRLAAHRKGWIDAMVPQAVEVWAKDEAGLGWPRTAATHHVADQLIHLGYGSTCGAIYALCVRPRESASLGRSLGLGLGLWAIGSMLLFPALKIARPVWRQQPREELVNVSAHVLYGAVTSLVLDEFGRQAQTQPRTHGMARRARIG